MKKDNEIAQAIDAGQANAKLDAAIRCVLSNKPVLARILKAFVEEFKPFTVQEIEQNIEGTVEVSSVPVMPDLRIKESGKGPVIEGRNTEDFSVNEGTVRYDILFNAYVPGSHETIKLIINVEAQNKSNPGYRIVKRALYYGARMISSQNGREFSNSDYDRISKAVSIWLVFDTKQEQSGSVTRYFMKEECMVGATSEPVENYDLLEIIMAYVGKGNEDPGSVLRMLEVLVSPEYSSENKKKILEEDYGIAMTFNEEGEVKSMGSFSEYYLEIGKEQGLLEGTERTKLSTIRSLITKKNWSAEEAMDLVDIPKEDRKKYYQLLEKEGLILS